VAEAVAGKGKPTRANWDLATGKGARSASSGGVYVAAGDIDGDGAADLAYIQNQPEISALSLGFDKASPVLAKVCAGKHIAKATLSRNGDSYEICDAMVSCSAASGGADALTDGLLIVRFSSGQMKHTKTGHVTLLK
jgi:hypothetical protein